MPKFIPKSHYQVLGIKPDSTSEDITHAYKQLNSGKLHNGEDGGITQNMLQIQHAYEVLSDSFRRRDYDYFGQDEVQDVIKSLQKHAGGASSKIPLPLWHPFNYEPSDLGTGSLALKNINTFLEGKEAWLIQIYSVASRICRQNEWAWQQISEQMIGVARVGLVELGEIQLATFFAEKNRATGKPFFRHGLPAYVAFQPNCRNQDCSARYAGERSVDGIVNWMAKDILRLPRILYYSPQTVVTDLIQKSGPHKVKVIIFSTTGQRAVPFLRKAARDFWDYAAFGMVLWHEENATLWENMLGVESAPAVLFLQDPGIRPKIFYGKLNSSTFELLMQEHKTHVLPQLRSVTADELGCNGAGYSIGGKDIQTWYCVIVAGRPGLELSQARAVLRGVQENLTKEVSSGFEGECLSDFSNAVSAFNQKRLSLSWLDGLTQKQLCYFYLNSEKVYETCGPKSFPEQNDVPRIFLVRYRRHPKDHHFFLQKKSRFNSIWQKLLEEEEDLASQIVAKYNGSMEVSEIVFWVSEMIKEGDSEDLLFYIKRPPALVSEESKPAWLVNARTYVSLKSEGILQKCRSFVLGMLDYVKEPNVMPTVVLVVILYTGSLVFASKQ